MVYVSIFHPFGIKTCPLDTLTYMNNRTVSSTDTFITSNPHLSRLGIL